jgi:hypothetical protein
MAERVEEGGEKRGRGAQARRASRDFIDEMGGDGEDAPTRPGVPSYGSAEAEKKS